MKTELRILINERIDCLIDYWGCGFNHKLMKPTMGFLCEGLEYDITNIDEETNTFELWDNKGKIGTYKVQNLQELWNKSVVVKKFESNNGGVKTKNKTSTTTLMSV